LFFGATSRGKPNCEEGKHKPENHKKIKEQSKEK
jgi:hypothetical protein